MSNQYMTADHNVEGRPPEFDAKLMSYRRYLNKLAGRHCVTQEQRNDLVTDTIIYCLKNWQSYRPDGHFWNWLYWAMRGVVSASRKAHGRQLPTVSDADGKYSHMASTPAPQLDYVELSQTLRKMNHRGGKIVVRRAMGETLPVIAADLGITAERVRQLECREMKRLKCVRAA